MQGRVVQRVICVKLCGKDRDCYRCSEKGQTTRGGGGFSFIWRVKDTEDVDKQTGEDSIMAHIDSLAHLFGPLFRWGSRKEEKELSSILSQP